MISLPFLIFFFLIFIIGIALLIVVAIYSHYYYFQFRPFMKTNYKYLLDWANGIDMGFYKQHGGASNPVRGVRLFVYPPVEIAERADYIDFRNEAGFSKMRRFTVIISSLTILLIINMTALLITIKIASGS